MLAGYIFLTKPKPSSLVHNSFTEKKSHSAAGNRTPVSRVTGGDTNHYTTADMFSVSVIRTEQNRQPVASKMGLRFVHEKIMTENVAVASPDEKYRKKSHSAAGNRTPVSRVTGGDTNHYTTADDIIVSFILIT